MTPVPLRLHYGARMYHGGRLVLASRKFFTSTLLLALLMVFSGCSWFGGDDDDLIADSGEQQLYRESQRHLKNENFGLAVRSLQMLESRYPFGSYAEQAQLELIYAHYGAYEFEAATESADRFIRLHPRHPSVDYAFYMKGLAAYDIEPGFFSRFIPSDDTKRDVSHIQVAFAEFAQLLARYPDSAYAPDARQRMVHMRNMLARHEIHVANYYFRRGAYMAALNRGKYVVEHMQQTPSVADGLAIMAQAYLLLGLKIWPTTPSTCCARTSRTTRISRQAVTLTAFIQRMACNAPG